MKSKGFVHQSGSAMTEFVVVAVVLVPLMFGIPMIGSVIDLQQKAVQASRYSAWETTVGSPATAQNLDQRFFSDESVLITDSAPASNKLWGARQNQDRTAADPLTGYYADTEIVVTDGASMSNHMRAHDTAVNSEGNVFAPSADKRATYVFEQAVKKLGVISDVTGGDWEDMETDGLVRGIASVTTQGNAWIDPITITQGTIIMDDNWSVEGARAARDRVRSLVPAGALDDVGKMIGTFGRTPGIRELKVFRNDGGRRVFGYVNMEPLPPSEAKGKRPLKQYSP